MSSYEQTSLQGSTVMRLRAQVWEVDCLSSKPVYLYVSHWLSAHVFICLLSTSSCPSDLDPVLCPHDFPYRAHEEGAVGGLGYPEYLPLTWLLSVPWVQEGQKPKTWARKQRMLPYSFSISLNLGSYMLSTWTQ